MDCTLIGVAAVHIIAQGAYLEVCAESRCAMSSALQPTVSMFIATAAILVRIQPLLRCDACIEGCDACDEHILCLQLCSAVVCGQVTALLLEA